MEITRDIILDLLPVYLAGEASPATRTLVEEFIRHDADLAQRVRELSQQNLAALQATPLPPPELELKSLRRTRALIGWQRWLFGLAIGFTIPVLSFEIDIENGHLREFHFLLHNHPLLFGAALVLGAGCWLGYYRIRRQMRTA
jgi:predicted anti-sigma-YlaC factor YlaD